MILRTPRSLQGLGCYDLGQSQPALSVVVGRRRSREDLMRGCDLLSDKTVPVADATSANCCLVSSSRILAWDVSFVGLLLHV